MFSVVEFPDTEEVDIVPVSWISSNQDFCWWPNLRSATAIKNAVMKSENPTSTKFSLYKIRVLRTFDNYNDARKKLPAAEVDSDLNSEAESTPKSRRVKYQPRRLPSHDEDDDSDNSDPQPSHVLALVSNGRTEMPPPPRPPSELSIPKPNENPPQGTSKSAVAALNVASSEAECNSSLQKGSKPDGVEIAARQDVKKIGFENWMIRQVGIMKAQIKNAQESLDILIAARNGDSSAKKPRLDDDVEQQLRSLIPVKSMNDIDGLLEALKNDVIRKALIFKLSLRGGSDLKDCVRRVMSSLLSDVVAMNFSWLGSRGGKLGFAGSSLKSIVYESIRKTSKMSESEDVKIEDALKNWLKNAKKRMIAKAPQGAADNS